MGELRRTDGTASRRLLSQHLIGRGPECALRLLDRSISSQHALVRWQGRGWEVIDRASTNGTRLNGELLEPGRPARLIRGAILTFGQSESWSLWDASEPEVMAIAIDDGTVLSGAHGLIGLPCGEDPELTLYRELDGCWLVEAQDGSTRPLVDGETLTSRGRDYRFCLPSGSEATADIGARLPDGEPTLAFSVSLDEDFVDLKFEAGPRIVPLGCRAHNYLLLTLARRSVADAEAGFAPTACGWVDKDELADGLRMTPQQVDGEVFRIRKHFASKGLCEAATIIERRPRTKQIRLGVRTVRIERV